MEHILRNQCPFALIERNRLLLKELLDQPRSLSE
jgi:hypothetical protein